MRWFQALVARVRRHPRAFSAAALAVVLVALHGRTLLEHLALAADPWRFNDDVRVLIHPQFRWEDPGLFPVDPSVDYFLDSLPEGYRLLYRALGPLVSVTALSKALPVLLLAVAVACIGLSAARLSGAAAALGAMSLSLGSAYVLGRMVGGLPRGFALPLLAAGALCLVTGRVRTLAALAVLAVGFYPAAGLTLGATLALLLLLPARDRGSASDWSLRRRVVLLAVTAAAAVLMLLPTAARLAPWGPAVTPNDWREYPEAGPGGRYDPVDRAPFPALPRAALEPIEAALIGAGDPSVRGLSLRPYGAWLAPLLVVLGLGGWAVLARRRSDARRLLLLPLALAVCHTLALAVDPLLFLPQRYVAYAVPLVALLAAPTALGALCDAKSAWLRCTPIAFNVALLVTLGASGSAWTGVSVGVPPNERPLYAVVAALPRGAVIASMPSETNDSIPYLARRSVFLTREGHLPFHTRYTLLMRKRARALFSAYFAVSEAELTRFRDEWHVTHLLVDLRHYATRPTYFAPFDPDVARAFDRGKESGFIAPALRARAQTFALDSYVLLDLERL